MNLSPFLALNYVPKLPLTADYGIGLIGAGQIVNQAHLPAYRKAGFSVVAIADRNRTAAEETAQRFAIPRVCASVEELLEISAIDVVDIAVPAIANPELTRQALAAGKHVLVQKPMAETLEGAEAMIAAAHAAKRKLAVNQQMRWAPSVRAASDLLRKGLFGELVECSIQIQVRTPWDSWPWLQTHPYPELTYHSIHHLDTMRAWLGDPQLVFATLAHYPGARCTGPTRNHIVLEYPGDLRASIQVNHHSIAPADDLAAKFIIEGTEGRCEGSIGLLLNYPVGRSDLLTFSHRTLTPAGAIRLELEGRWFPDAFIGPMSSLMDAITLDQEPETSGQQILGTLRLLDAVRQSHKSRQTVSLSR